MSPCAAGRRTSAGQLVGPPGKWGLSAAFRRWPGGGATTEVPTGSEYLGIAKVRPVGGIARSTLPPDEEFSEVEIEPMGQLVPRRWLSGPKVRQLFVRHVQRHVSEWAPQCGPFALMGVTFG